MSAGAKDPRVDAYIAKAPAFAQPILTEVRKRVFAAVPGIEETIKWNVPFYVIGGKLVASMAAFKAHAKVGVWLDVKPDMVDVTTVAELPPAKEHIARVKEAAARAEGGSAPAPATKAAAKKAAPAKKAAAKKAAPAKKAAAKKAAPAKR